MGGSGEVLTLLLRRTAVLIHPCQQHTCTERQHTTNNYVGTNMQHPNASGNGGTESKPHAIIHPTVAANGRPTPPFRSPFLVAEH